MTNKLRISIKENTALLTIDNPPANTWDLESLNFLEESVKELNNNKEIFSLIITGEGEKFFSAGVTECVDEVKALKGIDVAFLPMHIPLGRTTPAAAADCAKALDPDIVYTYHYDQDWVRRLGNPDFSGSTLPGGLSVPETLDEFEKELDGTDIVFQRGDWYPD